MRLRLGGGLRRLLVLVLLGVGRRSCFGNGLRARGRLKAAVVLRDAKTDKVWWRSSVWRSYLMTSSGHHLRLQHVFQLCRGVLLFPPVLVSDSWGRRGGFVLKDRSRCRWACAGRDCTRCGVAGWGSEPPVEPAFAGGTQELKTIHLLLISNCRSGYSSNNKGFDYMLWIQIGVALWGSVGLESVI